MVITLDMEKAYAGLDWNFIKKCFNDLGLCEKWTNRIMQWITTTTFSMIVNEKPGNAFQFEREIR